MTAVAAPPLSPYKGLAPFEDSELDALLFFGRERETEVIVANLLASPLTVLYGPSGVGKSSVLRAAVVPRLREIAPEAEIHVLSEWTAGAELPEPDDEAYVILDQFEESFLYEARVPLVETLPALLGRPRAHVLLSLREDALARLDAFQARIPTVLANRLRLDHLDEAAARAAITRPLDVLNRLVGAEDAVAIVPALVDAVLEQVAAAAEESGGRAPPRIETPYLQLVLQRIWDEERSAGSRTFRLATLRRLGGARAIVRDHLQRALGALPPHDAEVASAALKFLVTPSRTKISQSVEDLVGYTDESPADLRTVLDRLAQQRIVRAVAAEGEAPPRYEIFHDVLAEPVLVWRREQEAQAALEGERGRMRRRHRRLLAFAGVVAFVAAALAALAVFALVERHDAQQHAAAARRQQVQAEAEKARADANYRTAVTQRRLAEKQEAAATAAEGRARTSEAAAKRAAAAARRAQAVALTEARRARASEGAQARAAAAARAARQRADEAATAARAAAARATSAKHAALVQKARADAAARRARVGDLVSSSDAALGTNGAKSVRDALAAAALEQSPRVESALRTALARFRLRGVLEAGGGAVTAAAFAPDGRRVAVGGRGGWVRVYDVASHRLAYAVRVRGGADAVAFSPDGRLLAIAGGAAQVYDAGTGAPLRALAGTAGVYAVQFASADRLVTASTDGALRVWEPRTGALLRAIDARGAAQLALSPDGSLAATFAAGDPVARVYSLDSGALVATPVQTGEVVDLAWSRDGSRLATAGRRNVYVWNRDGWSRLSLLTGATAVLEDVAFFPDGRVIAASADSAARIYDGTTGELRMTLIGQHQQVITSLAVSGDGRMVATGSADRTARLWPAPLGSVPHVLAGHTGTVTSVAFDPTGTSLLTASADGTARLWSTDSPALTPLGRHDGSANAVALSPDRTRVVTGGADGTARVWSVGGRLELTVRHGGAVTRVAFLGRDRILTASADGTARTWRVSDGTPLVTFGHGAPVRAVAVLPGGTVVTGGDDGDVRAWSASGRPLWSARHGSPVVEVAAGASGVVASAGADGDARLWRASTGALLHVLAAHAGAIADVAFSPDGRTVATAGSDGVARIWDVATGRLDHALGGHRQGLTSVEFSPDGKRLLTAGVDGDARLWSAATGRPLHVLSYHVARISRGVYSADGRWILTAGPADAGLWNAATGELLLAIEGGDGPLNDGAIAADGSRIATVSANGTVATYACTVCGRLPALRADARKRLASLRWR